MHVLNTCKPKDGCIWKKVCNFHYEVVGKITSLTFLDGGCLSTLPGSPGKCQKTEWDLGINIITSQVPAITQVYI